MAPPEPDTSAAQDAPGRRLRQARDRSMVLCLIGWVLILPPVAGIVDMPATLGGIPATLIYLFAVWALLIFGARSVAARLGEEAEAEAQARQGAEAATAPGHGRG